MTANIITLSRIPFFVLLLVFKPDSYPFAVFYLLCGITDILDGFVARKLRTESEKGANLDSIADLIFAVVYVIRILPLLSVPYWIWIWTAIIAVIKIAGIVIAGRKTQKLLIEHSFGNKFTGFLLFILPLSVYITDVKYGATTVCTVATVTAIVEIIKNIGGLKNMIETKRLKIYPACEEQMKAFIEEQTIDVLKAAYSEMLNGALTHPEQWEWYAIWMIELKDGTHIGELCFKGVDESGSPEIGYGVAEKYQGYGYATEAVSAVVDWALKQKIINCVTAEVDKGNIASIKVLEKSGFKLTGRIGEEGPIYSKK